MKLKPARIAPLVIALLWVQLRPLQAEVVTGRARVSDGDTIQIAGTKVRLHGIDAPEAAQTCKGAKGRNYPCGQVATRRLRDLTANRAVTCRGDERDQYGRLLGTCAVAGRVINGVLVREGLAWAFVRYTDVYLTQEREARAARRGVFTVYNVPPWEFRAGHRSEPVKREALKGCSIKGNVSRDGERIYHLPWQRDYARVGISTGAGERWFCNEAEARRAGWRKALR